MNLPLQYSNIDENENKKKPQKKNRTYKNRKPTKKVASFLKTMDGGDDSDLENFESPAKMNEVRNVKVPDSTDLDPNGVEINSANAQYNAVTENYYKQYLPYYTKAADSQALQGERDILIEKLNYMTHLLESQQEEKTSNITEELILYMFLGVFVIFVVDSFARAGKYTR